MLVTDSLLAYTLAATLLTLTPGLDTALILRTATAEGGRKALHAALGIDLGCFIWGALVAFGLGALLAVSELAYTLLKWCGAGYLCWASSCSCDHASNLTPTRPNQIPRVTGSCVGCWGMCLTPKWASSTFRFCPSLSLPGIHRSAGPFSWSPSMY